jgi:electron transfer flavoprotein beta subunit
MDDIIVCVKQVPNTTYIKLDPVHHTLMREGVPSIMNPFDDIALEAALQCKSRTGVKVGVLTMGPPQAERMLEQCLGWGADEAFLLTDRRLAGSDTLATARALRAAVRLTGYRTVFCGQETIDSSTGHICASLAEMFGIPQATNVTRILEAKEGEIHVEVEQDRSVQVLRIALPAVISFAKASRQPRAEAAPRRSGTVRRLSLEDVGLAESEVGLEGSPTTVVDIDIDTTSVDYLVVDGALSAFDRIRTVLNGGIEEKTNRLIYRSLDKDATDSIVALLR